MNILFARSLLCLVVACQERDNIIERAGLMWMTKCALTWTYITLHLIEHETPLASVCRVELSAWGLTSILPDVGYSKN